MKELAIMICVDCSEVRHRIVPEDSTIECGACGSENVIYPYNPKYLAQQVTDLIVSIDTVRDAIKLEETL
tara:strand:- start:560 stop:769 length:210 start_codon:yes stop_codon:yes gene_type:complete